MISLTKGLAGNLGLVLLGIWLILTGLARLLPINIPSGGLLLELLALAAGAVILMGGIRTYIGNPGFILLGVWLVLSAVVALLPLRVRGLGTVLALLELGAGVLLLIVARTRSISRYPGVILLSIWLIVNGVLGLVAFNLPGLGTVLAILAVAAGFFILLER
jgi:hypothetical protein